MAVVQFAIQISLLFKGERYITSSLTIDDTYYYLQTAWNTKQLGLVSFDGLHTTNGVQLLWFLVIYLLALLVKTKIILLFVTLALSFLFNGLCYIFIFLIGKELNRPSLILIIASLWALQSLPFRIYSMGMENSLHALVIWCTLWQCVIFIVRAQNKERPNFWGLTIVLILNTWSRLDSALLSTILFIFCTAALVLIYRKELRVFLKKYARTVIYVSLLAGFGFITQVAAFRWMGDSYLPVSALVKTSGIARGLSAESIKMFMDVFLLGLPSILQGRLSPIALITLGILGILVVFLLRSKYTRQSENLRIFINLWCCMLVGEVLYYFLIAVSGAAYLPYFAWYRSPSFIFWILTGAFVALLTFEQIKPVSLHMNFHLWVPVGFSLAVVSIAVFLFFRSINFTSQLYTARYDTALWISENFLPDTIFASWNAGQLGYFSNRTFINLDGVINNVDYYRRVLHGPISIADYLAENDVDYVVDYDTYGFIPDFPILRTFPVNDGTGRSIRIWQVSSQASSAR
ncbi:MAG: hypothetical protein A2Z16_11365 [Chloroflexi bacterium RBG_16_54_18]|nr:MAG: hypothetical protein A2Z16_11365 [Chloroflexi bacterium RBG_16_54_18]